MLKRIGVALIAIALLLPLQVMAQKGGRLSSRSSSTPSNSDAIRRVRGPSVNGTMKNYQMVKWTTGDTIIVPAGVPHSMGFEVTERTDILQVVFDPKKAIEEK
jgi:hypothetical protein